MPERSRWVSGVVAVALMATVCAWLWLGRSPVTPADDVETTAEAMSDVDAQRADDDTDGSSVEGAVVAEGDPVFHARVRIEPLRIESHTLEGGQRATTARAPAAHTGADGRFCVTGLAAGGHRVIVTTPEHTPWVGSCTVAAGATHHLRIELVAGAVCMGTVRTASRSVAAGAEILATDGPSELTRRTRAGPDGRYSLRGHGTCRETVSGYAGETVYRDLALAIGPRTLRGRVITELGELVGNAVVRVADAEGRRRFVRSNDIGRFELPGCPATGLLEVAVRSGGFFVGRWDDVDPDAGDVELRVRSAANARILGVVLDARGERVRGASVVPHFRGSTNSPMRRTNARGEFEFRSVPYGTYRLMVMASGHARYRSGDFELASRGTVDRGEIRLVRGGQVVVTLRREIAAQHDIRLLVWSKETRFVQSMRGSDTVLRSRLLQPGDYRLGVEVDGELRERRIPFTIRDESNTEFELTVR